MWNVCIIYGTINIGLNQITKVGRLTKPLFILLHQAHHMLVVWQIFIAKVILCLKNHKRIPRYLRTYITPKLWINRTNKKAQATTFALVTNAKYQS